MVLLRCNITWAEFIHRYTPTQFKDVIPGVYQAGQWTYSPSGLPVSILTGKIAADRVSKALGKSRR